MVIPGIETPIIICSANTTTPFSPLSVSVPHTNYTFDVAMVNIFTTLGQPSLNYRLIANVLIRDITPVSVSADTSNNMHHKITAEQVSKKWGCGLGTARKILKTRI